MKKEEIAIYADQVTYANQRTIVKLSNNKEYVGFFILTEHNSELRNNNKWNFTVLQHENKSEENIILNGNDIISIDIKTIF